jgi:hypothetical protein
MARKVLDNIRMGMTWTSYIAAVDGILRNAGLWNDEVYKLMGMTGTAFRFIVHDRICTSSVTVYDWSEEHLTAMDRIGLHTDVYAVEDIRINTFAEQREAAVQRIKESIDRGVGVLVWAPTRILEFGIIHGYDDADGVFLVQECTMQPADPMLYTNLGKSEVPMLFYQLFHGKVDVDREKVYRDSLQYGVKQWNKEFHVCPDYASGRKGYINMITALEKMDFIDFGLAYLLVVYADSKKCIAQYLNDVHQNTKQLKGLDKAAELYGAVADRYEKMCELFPFSGSNGVGCNADRNNVPAVLELFKECSLLEEEAMTLIAKSVGM